MAIMYTYNENMDNEKMTFLSTLYHDKRGGQMIRLHITDGNAKPVSLSTCDIKELAATGTDGGHWYTTINTFRGCKRTSDQIFCYCSIYIDIDCHAENSDKIADAKVRTIKLLEKAFEEGALAVPTMITDTGRGFGIQYVLQRSIANTFRTKAQRAFFCKVRDQIFDKYVEILKQDPLAAQPDPSVLDDARVCRLPGTYNNRAGAYCRLITVTNRYYELSDLVKECHLWVWKDKETYQKEKRRVQDKQYQSENVINFSEYRFLFLKNRITQLEKLQDLRREKCTDRCREIMLFIAYSALTQIDHASAASKLKELNNRFTDPLEQKELDHIIRETNRSKGKDHQGYYKLSNRYIVSSLGLTDEEVMEIGLGGTWKRDIQKQENRRKREEKRQEVIGLLKQADRLTYNEIAERAGVSRRTVCSIAKDEGLGRYRKTQTEEKQIIRDGSKQETMCGISESANFNTESVCVSELGSWGSFSLSTSCGDWLSILELFARTSIIARQLLRLYNDTLPNTLLSAQIASYLALSVASYATLDIVKLYQTQIRDLNVIARWVIDVQYGYRNFASVSASVSSSYAYQNSIQVKKNQPIRKEETTKQNVERINKYLRKYTDVRFEVIDATEEYQRRLNPDVLHQVKVAFMQVERLKREYLSIEGREVSTEEIKSCFRSMSYKDIVVICERMGRKGTILHAKKPFFYVVQCVWKYKHPDDAAAQAMRIQKERGKKQSNSFCDFKQKNNTDIYKLIKINSMRDFDFK